MVVQELVILGRNHAANDYRNVTATHLLCVLTFRRRTRRQGNVQCVSQQVEKERWRSCRHGWPSGRSVYPQLAHACGAGDDGGRTESSNERGDEGLVTGGLGAHANDVHVGINALLSNLLWCLLQVGST